METETPKEHTDNSNKIIVVVTIAVVAVLLLVIGLQFTKSAPIGADYHSRLKSASIDVESFLVMADLSLSTGSRDEEYDRLKARATEALQHLNNPPDRYQQAFKLVTELFTIAERFDDGKISTKESDDARKRRAAIDSELKILLAK